MQHLRDQQSIAAQTWAHRAHAEVGAAARFALISNQLRAIHYPEKICELVDKAEKDEKHHVQLCSSVAKHYGFVGDFNASGNEAHSLQVPPSWNSLPLQRDRLLCDIVLMCCVTESANASLLDRIASSIKTTTKVGRITRTILQDEITHGQIGWAVLAHESTKRDCGFIAEFLPDMFALAANDEFFVPVAAEENGEAILQFGVLPAHLRLEQFKKTLEEIVLPGFAHFKIDISHAQGWLDTKLRGTALKTRQIAPI